MSAELLDMYRKSLEGPLDPDAVRKLEEWVQEHPYFVLPHLILARQAYQNGQDPQPLMRAAAYAPDRRKLFEYIEGSVFTGKNTFESLPDQYPENEGELSKVAHALAADLKEGEEPADAALVEETSAEPKASEEETEKTDGENAGIATEAEAQVEPETETSGESIAETSEASSPEEEPVEVAASAESLEESETEATSEATENEDKEASEATEFRESEEKHTPGLDPEEADALRERIMATGNDIGINWYLNAKLNMRTSRYGRLAEKIRSELVTFKENPDAFAPNPGEVSEAPAETQPEAETPTTEAGPEPSEEVKSENEIFEGPADQSEAVAETSPEAIEAEPKTSEEASPEEEKTEAQAQIVEAGEKQEETEESEPAPELVSGTENPATSDTTTEESETHTRESHSEEEDSESGGPFFEIAPDFAAERGLPEKIELEFAPSGEENTAAAQPETSAESDPLELEYAIGAYSGLQFLETEAPAVPQSSDEGLVVDEGNRILEISITPEQLAKYFKHSPPAPAEIEANLEAEATEEEPIAEPAPELEKQESLIDKFIEEEPSLGDTASYEIKDKTLGKDSVQESDELVSETLARIHAGQGNYKKATRIYEKLGLLFPEKKEYFATQIKNLKK